MKCIRCESTVRIGTTEMCPRNPERGEYPASGYHEGQAHTFTPGFDGLCNWVDPDFGMRCGFGRFEYEQGIAGAPVHELLVPAGADHNQREERDERPE